MHLQAAITGTGKYVPEDILTNEQICKMVDTSTEWILERTGIQERRILKDPNLATSYLGVQAAKDLLSKTGVDPRDIDLVICSTVTPDYFFPSSANLITSEIGAINAFSYDLMAACSGFLFAFNTGAQFISSGTYKKVLVIGADKMSSIIDYTDRTTCILFGDGAGAVLLEPNEEGFGLCESYLRSDAIGKELLYMKAGGSLHPPTAETIIKNEHSIQQKGRQIFRYAVNFMGDAIQKVITKSKLQIKDLSYLVPHQANLRIISHMSKKFDIPMEKVMVNIHRYGNTTNATIPLCLADYESKLKQGDDIIMCAFGGGFTWGAAHVKWAY